MVGLGASKKGSTNSACDSFLSLDLPLMCDPSSEVFVSDQTTNLFAVDMRKGRVIYGYKGNFFFLSVLYY